MVVEYIIVSALSNISMGLINGSNARETQKEINQENREQARRNRAEDMEISKQRYIEEMAFRKEQLDFSKAESLRRAYEFSKTLEFQQQFKRDERSFDTLSKVFNGSLDGMWLHDPYMNEENKIKSLRVFSEPFADKRSPLNAVVDMKLVAAIEKYRRCGSDYNIHFPTGVWHKDVSSGSWVSSEMHKVKQDIPTFMFRAVRVSDKTVAIQADMFGFPINNGTYQSDIYCGEIENDPETISQVFSLLTLTVADMYFLSSYAKAPLVPYMLKDFSANMKDEKIIQGIVSAYQVTLNRLLSNDFGTGIYAALNLAEGFMAFPDKKYAITQLKYIEEISQNMNSHMPKLNEVLQNLYTHAGTLDDVERLKKTEFSQPKLFIPEQLGGFYL